jgi:hypothetical protein
MTEVRKLSDDPKKMQDGLAQLVLTVLETLRQLMEKQATHRIREGSLTDGEVEALGLRFMELKAKIREVAAIFNIPEEKLGLNLGPLGDLVDSQERVDSVTLVDLLDKVIEKGVIVFGDVGISVADVELITVKLRLLVSPVKPPLRRMPPRRITPKRARKLPAKVVHAQEAERITEETIQE